jgi:hypothetical protein
LGTSGGLPFEIAMSATLEGTAAAMVLDFVRRDIKIHYAVSTEVL